jgi:hypothetical protein
MTSQGEMGSYRTVLELVQTHGGAMRFGVTDMFVITARAEGVRESSFIGGELSPRDARTEALVLRRYPTLPTRTTPRGAPSLRWRRSTPSWNRTSAVVSIGAFAASVRCSVRDGRPGGRLCPLCRLRARRDVACCHD